MTSLRIFVLAVTLPAFSSTVFASSKQTEAASLIERAKQLSDIRVDGAPAFRLRLDFKLTKKDGSILEGSYTEVWGSRDQWRRETVAGDLHRTEVAAGGKRFLIEPVKPLPEHIADLPALAEIGKFRPEAWNPEKLENRKLNGASVRCIETTPVERVGFHPSIARGPEGLGDAPSLCFDRSSGALAVEVEPAISRSEDTVCFFEDYQKFRDRIYARSYKCAEGGQARFEATVVELVILSQSDPELFTFPKGAKELSGCPDPVKPPIGVYEPPPRSAAASGVVVISTSVSIDGTPRDLSIVSSASPKLEKVTLEAVRQWRFRPATCDREPVEMKIAVEVGTQIQ